MSTGAVQKHHKIDFQIERIALFSDAVFAIAITLLVIELKIPEFNNGDPLTDTSLWQSLLAETAPKMVGFLISFFVIGMYWFNHHKLFGFIVNYSRRLLWKNLLFLLTIVLMPFATALYGDYYGYSATIKLPVLIYTVNICLSGVTSYRLWQFAGSAKNHLSVGLNDKPLLRYYKLRCLVTPLFFCIYLSILIH